MKSRQANSIYRYNSDAGMILYVFVIFACSFYKVADNAKPTNSETTILGG